jgi:hypothetical protein
MAIQVPKPQKGPDLTIFTLTGQAVSGAGVLTDSGSAISLWGVRRGIGLETTPSKTGINSASRNVANEIIMETGRSLRIEIFKVNNTTDPNPIETLIESFDYIKASWTVGTATGSIEAMVFYGLRGAVAENLEGQGEHIATMELGPCDVQWASTLAGVGTTAQLTRSIS